MSEQISNNTQTGSFGLPALPALPTMRDYIEAAWHKVMTPLQPVSFTGAGGGAPLSLQPQHALPAMKPNSPEFPDLGKSWRDGWELSQAIRARNAQRGNGLGSSYGTAGSEDASAGGTFNSGAW